MPPVQPWTRFLPIGQISSIYFWTDTLATQMVRVMRPLMVGTMCRHLRPLQNLSHVEMSR